MVVKEVIVTKAKVSPLKKVKSSFSSSSFLALVNSAQLVPISLPKSTSMSKANWKLRGPYNVGGRTRALAFDVLNIFCLSQKFSKQENSPKAIYSEKNGDYFKYNNGKKQTLVAMGFAAYAAVNLIKNNFN